MQGYIKVNDVTPYGNKKLLELMKYKLLTITYENELKKTLNFYSENRSINILFGSAFVWKNINSQWSMHFNSKRQLIFYINIFEKDTPEKWGDRYGELKLTLTDFVPENEYPNYVLYLEELWEMFDRRTDIEKYSFPTIRKVLDSLEKKYSFRDKYTV